MHIQTHLVFAVAEKAELPMNLHSKATTASGSSKISKIISKKHQNIKTTLTLTLTPNPSFEGETLQVNRVKCLISLY